MKVLRLLLVALCVALVQGSLAAAHDQADELYRIPFASGTVDPARAFAPQDPAAGDLVLVQFREFGAVGVVEALAATGARLVQPLAPVSYLVWADAAQTADIRALEAVRWAGVLPAQARVSGSVTAATTRLRVTVVGDDAVPGVRSGATWSRAFTQVAGSVFEVDGGAGTARELAALPYVYSVAAGGDVPAVRDEKSAQVIASGTKNGVAPGYRAFLDRIGADGSGVVISHVDTGADFNHPDLAGRRQACVGYGPAGPTECSAGNHDIGGHGTHTLGIIVGTGASGLKDLDGFAYGQGVAPGAKAVSQNAIGFTFASPFASGYRPIYRDAHDKGAIVSGNSWGPSGTPKGYDAATREFDSMVRDINDDALGDQPMALVFSIMNGRGGTSTQGSPDEGKNLVGVGGTGSRGLGAPSADDLCTCTAHGPALDGRLLPTLVAPGQNVVSTRSSTAATSCSNPAAGEPLPPSPLHAGCTGTSFASPHVTGGHAVFVEWYRKRFDGATPSPALVKAAFVNGADDLAGAKDANGKVMSNIPNNQQGWGRFNLGNVMDGWTGGAVHVDQSVVFTEPGQAHALRVVPVDPSKPLKVSLAWTDALGPGTGGKTPAWVNDLDLSVRADDGTTWLGNVFSQGASRTGGEHDRKNNLENVYLTEPQAPAYTVTVAASNLLGDGLPNVPGPVDQDFALVITNARLAD